MAFKRSIIWIDVGARTRQTLPLTAAGAGAIMSALKNHSNADVAEWFEGADNFPSTSPINAIYPSVNDIVRLTFATATADRIDLALPAPKASIFLADGVTVDASAIADIISASIGALSNPGGELATSFVSGLRGLRAAGN